MTYNVFGGTLNPTLLYTVMRVAGMINAPLSSAPLVIIIINNEKIRVTLCENAVGAPDIVNK